MRETECPGWGGCSALIFHIKARAGRRVSKASSFLCASQTIPVTQDRNRERGLCDPGSEEHAVCSNRFLGGRCDSVYTDTARGGSRTKGSRDRGEKAYAGKVGLSRAACTRYRPARRGDTLDR